MACSGTALWIRNYKKYNRINGVVKRSFGKGICNETKPRRHNITAKAALICGREAWC
jgi:hypothetical protein